MEEQELESGASNNGKVCLLLLGFFKIKEKKMEGKLNPWLLRQNILVSQNLPTAGPCKGFPSRQNSSLAFLSLFLRELIEGFGLNWARVVRSLGKGCWNFSLTYPCVGLTKVRCSQAAQTLHLLNPQ
ncbi:unnamed protein product [Prunus armeniaca]